MHVNRSLVLLYLALACCLGMTAGCESCAENSDDDDHEHEQPNDDDDTSPAGDDDNNNDATPDQACLTTISHESGDYQMSIAVSLSVNCEATIVYQRVRFDGSGDPEPIEEQAPIFNLPIDRDTALYYHSINANGIEEEQHEAIYNFPPKFGGLQYAHSGDESITLQWQEAWDSAQPITYLIYQPISDEPISTLQPIAVTNALQYTVTTADITLATGERECFVVRAVDDDGLADHNNISRCLAPWPVFYVDAVAPDGGDGTIAHPFNMIQAANDALPDDRRFTNVYVAGGVYEESLDFSNNDPPVTAEIHAVQIFGGFDPASWRRDPAAYPSIVDAGGAAYGWQPGEWDFLDGFYITGANDGLAIVNHMSITAINCVLYGNARYGLLVSGSDIIAGPSITSSVMTGNGSGIGLLASADADSDAGVDIFLRNLIIYDNLEMGIHGWSSGMNSHTSFLEARARNLVITGNAIGFAAETEGANVAAEFEISNNYIGENTTDLSAIGCTPDDFFIEYSDILAPGDFTGVMIMSVAPEFIDAPADFHLQDGSPLIDAGVPDPLFEDPDHTRNDIGAFGGVGGYWQPLPYLFE